MPYADPAMQVECSRRWYEAHREERKAAERVRYRAKKPEIVDQQLRRKYGISIADYEAMLEAQGGGCAICSGTSAGRKGHNRMHVDHDHDTGQVRGLLCHHCNTALGLVKDNADTLRRMADYLER